MMSRKQFYQYRGEDPPPLRPKKTKARKMFLRGDLVRVFPINGDDPEAVAHTGKKFRVVRTRTTLGQITLVMVVDNNDSFAHRVFRECDLLKVKGD